MYSSHATAIGIYRLEEVGLLYTLKIKFFVNMLNLVQFFETSIFYQKIAYTANFVSTKSSFS